MSPPLQIPQPIPQHMKVQMKATSWRGPNFMLIFSIARLDCGEVIYVGPITSPTRMVEYRFRFMMDARNKCRLISRVSFQKHQKARNSTIFVEVSCENFVKECLCPDDWIEFINVEPAIEIFKQYTNCKVKVCHQFLTIHVNITMREVTPEPLPVYKKLCEDTTFTDFSLKAGDGSVAVQRVILGMHSDVFLAMLNEEWKETVEGIISLNGVTRQTLQHLKDYMYLSTLPEDLPQLQQLLLLAACYMVDNLKTDCIAKLVASVTLENFDALVEFACQNNLPDLVKAIVTEVPEKVVCSIQKKKQHIKREISTEDMK